MRSSAAGSQAGGGSPSPRARPGLKPGRGRHSKARIRDGARHGGHDGLVKIPAPCQPAATAVSAHEALATGARCRGRLGHVPGRKKPLHFSLPRRAMMQPSSLRPAARKPGRHPEQPGPRERSLPPATATTEPAAAGKPCFGCQGGSPRTKDLIHPCPCVTRSRVCFRGSMAIRGAGGADELSGDRTHTMARLYLLRAPDMRPDLQRG